MYIVESLLVQTFASSQHSAQEQEQALEEPFDLYIRGVVVACLSLLLLHHLIIIIVIITEIP